MRPRSLYPDGATLVPRTCVELINVYSVATKFGFIPVIPEASISPVPRLLAQLVQCPGPLPTDSVAGSPARLLFRVLEPAHSMRGGSVIIQVPDQCVGQDSTRPPMSCEFNIDDGGKGQDKRVPRCQRRRAANQVCLRGDNVLGSCVER